MTLPTDERDPSAMGDILMRASDMEIMLNHLKGRHKRNLYNFHLNGDTLKRKWPMTINYGIKPSTYTSRYTSYKI